MINNRHLWSEYLKNVIKSEFSWFNEIDDENQAFDNKDAEDAENFDSQELKCTYAADNFLAEFDKSFDSTLDIEVQANEALEAIADIASNTNWILKSF